MASQINGHSHQGAAMSFLYRLKRLFRRDVNEDLQSLLEECDDADEPLTDSERNLISAALRFDELDADDATVPRSEVVYVRKGDGFKKVLDTFQSSHHSRLPVCGEDLDDVQGFITLKDFIRYIGHEKDFNMAEILRPATFVPLTQSIDTVLQQMRKARVQMAIVVDEYGGTAGLITLKDILEKLVGDLEDEHEKEDPVMLLPVANNRFRLNPKMKLEELEEHFQLPFRHEDDDDIDTIGGLILSLAGKVPESGTTFKLENGSIIEVSASDGRRIQRLEITCHNMPHAG